MATDYTKTSWELAGGNPPPDLRSFPPPDRWDDWEEFDAKAWPRKVAHHYMLVPTICFNCEAACGLLAYVDKETLKIKKLEGNPAHPGSRGRNCAKGPATINQVDDPERILYPLKRTGRRGEGQWARATWEEACATIGARMRRAIVEKRGNEIMYHVGRPGHDGFMDRVLQAWGIDGHNSHTNVCSASARLGYALWSGSDRPSPDHANARFILLLSAHLETGHYFNPHAQRIIECKMRGGKIAAMDPRLSNTASMSDWWLPTYPGSEAAVLLAMAKVLLDEGMIDREFVRRWVNWEDFLRAERPEAPVTFDRFLDEIKAIYSGYTLEFAEKESGCPARRIYEVAREIGRAGSAFSSHVWRGAASGNLGGWQVARCLQFLNVLVGAVGTPGGTAPHSWDKFVPAPFLKPPPQKSWNELTFPREFPLGHYEMSFLLPHFLKEGRGRVDVYFTRVYNPAWTNPDGLTWIEVLRDESKIGLHVALTPTWNETAYFADWVLPMGIGCERHDVQSQETQSGQWIGFRQPVLRVAKERLGKPVKLTYEANPGEVWEEDELWTELSWRIDPDGALSIRKYFESPYRAGEKLTVDDYYRWIFENSVPGLPEAAKKEGLTPLAYMRKYGAFEVSRDVYRLHEQTLPSEKKADGIDVDGTIKKGFPTPSKKLEFWSPTMKEWGWPEHVLPGYVRSHIHPSTMDRSKNEFVLVPTFRLPTLIHTRSANAKWLYEISNTNPVWIHPRDAESLAIRTGDLVKISTEIGWFVDKVFVTEGLMPSVVTCSHHLGRWRLHEGYGVDRWASALVDLQEIAPGQWMLRHKKGIEPFKSTDPDSERVSWRDAGVHQNLTFPVHPDPLSGMHCWHQKVRVEKPTGDERYGDVFVDTNRSMAIYREWMAKTRPAPGPGGLRRPTWLARPIRPVPEAFVLR
ncbi:MAG: molybdopterin-dependent oxidoreductase [Planctomycetes bacterium]|nr:molybdopterin-dependent oxidoreductase [Planctomycetota bacterium]